MNSIIYYSGTNELQRVTGSETQYTYDNNRNMTRDDPNDNTNIKYDHRNLITELYHVDASSGARPYTYATRYYYDEGGNRIRKLTYLNQQTNPGPVFNWNNLSSPGNGWILSKNEYYIKSYDGRDIALYNGNTHIEWYVWGIDMAGKLKGTQRYFYLKDHLGSTRAVVNGNGTVLAGYDYDAWGYLLENRSLNSDSIKFKYTGKERDKESLYDYFGARYYDSRVANWGSIDPLMEKHYDFSPYNYVLRNPLRLVDPDGQQVEFIQTALNIYSWYANEKIHSDYYSGLSLVGKEEFKKSQSDYSTGRIESAEIQPTDLISLPIGLSLAKKFPILAKSTERFVIEENIGLASDIGLDLFSGAKATSKNAEKLGKKLGEFLGEAKNTIKQSEGLIKFGNINKFGREVRVGVDKSHFFQHIDIERNKIGKIYKDLKLKISIENF